MSKKTITLFLLFAFFFSSCVGKKKFTQLEVDSQNTEKRLIETRKLLKTCEDNYAELADLLAKCESGLLASETELLSEVKNKENQIRLLEQELNYIKKTNTNLLDRLSDLSIVNKQGSESILKSLESLNDQNKYILDVNKKVQQKDSLNLALVMNLKRSLSNINDQDVQVEVKGGVVYISISDRLLFSSGSSKVNSSAFAVLEKVATVLNDHKDLNILVEGHTDNVPIKNSCVNDNWDLSAQRATSVVRVLQSNYGVEPYRMSASGRSEFVPKGDNTIAEGRQMNRRTEIIVTPRLDQFFELLTPGGGN